MAFGKVIEDRYGMSGIAEFGNTYLADISRTAGYKNVHVKTLERDGSGRQLEPSHQQKLFFLAVGP